MVNDVPSQRGASKSPGQESQSSSSPSPQLDNEENVEAPEEEAAQEGDASQEQEAPEELKDPEEIKFILRMYTYHMSQIGTGKVIAKWNNAQRMLTVGSEATVEHVCRFAITRMLVESTPPEHHREFDVDNVELYLNMGRGLEEKDYQKLPHEASLADVYRRYWNIKRPMELHFAIKGDIQFLGA